MGKDPPLGMVGTAVSRAHMQAVPNGLIDPPRRCLLELACQAWHVSLAADR